jgi:hypothetical protein
VATEIITCTVTASVLHLRGGPGVEYPVLDWLYAGDVLTITRPGAWARVEGGWIKSEFCEEAK